MTWVLDFLAQASIARNGRPTPEVLALNEAQVVEARRSLIGQLTSKHDGAEDP